VVTLSDGRELVLRRWHRPEWRTEDPGFTSEREARGLGLLESAAVRTPRVIAVGAELLLTDKLPGGPPPSRPRDIDSFLRQLAAVLPVIHAVEGELPLYERYYDRPTTPDTPVWRRASALAAQPPPPGRTCLIHRDYHPGNTLWAEGRLTGVVDWTQASIGPAAVDIGHMRWNLALAYGLDAAARFAKFAGAGPDQSYWDVVTALDVLPQAEAADVKRLERYVATCFPQPDA
jgi:aminoglycoside phosphotransferase (APT) family kinase protein